MKVAAVAWDLLEEARHRRWFVVLAGAVTLLLVLLAGALRLDVVDGMLAATTFFGRDMHRSLQDADVALRPLLRAASYTIFYGGLIFGVLACADFAPRLLSPGRIEHLLGLPIRRWELLVGTFLGVMALATAGAVYGSAGIVLILGVKTGIWSLGPVLSAILASTAFAALYGVMLTVAVVVRSAALSAAAGAGVFIAGVVAGYRTAILPAIEPGWTRSLFQAVTFVLPRISSLAEACAALATSQPADIILTARLVCGLLVFAAASVALGIWRFEVKDY